MGKKNKTRKTGRTKGGHNISHIKKDSGRHISFGMLDTSKLQSLNGAAISFSENMLRLLYPSPPEKFVPRHAYKALVKAGIAALPCNDLKDYSNLVDWLQHPNDGFDFPVLEAAFSLGSLGNSPALASISILRRKQDNLNSFHSIAVICVGSCCWAIDLKPDELDNHLPPIFSQAINLKWSAILGVKPDQIAIPYGDAVHFNWSDEDSRPTPIEAIKVTFDYQTTEGSFSPIYRPVR